MLHESVWSRPVLTSLQEWALGHYVVGEGITFGYCQTDRQTDSWIYLI